MRRHAAVFSVVVFLLLPGVAQAQLVRTISLSANDLVYDPVSARLYASVPSTAGPSGNSIAVINPVTGAVDAYVAVGSEPNKLALSDDGQYLYVGLDGAFAIRRLHVPTLTPGLQFTLGNDPYSGPYAAYDIAVLPGDASSVAVVRRAPSSGGDGGVGVYTDGVLRPLVTQGPYGSRVLAFSASSARLYGYNNVTTGYELFRMSVDANGVSVIDNARSLISGSEIDIRFSDGRLYAGNGRVVDPEAKTVIGTLARVGSSGSLTHVAADTASGRSYAITGTSPAVIRAYSLESFRWLWGLGIPGTLGTWKSLTTWGASGLAFRTTEGQIIIIDLALGRSLTVSRRGTGNGTVSSAPTGLQCGAECSTLFALGTGVTLTATPSAGSTFVGWEGDPDCADGSVTLSEARGCVAVFAQNGSGPSLQVPLATSDLVYSPATDKLYASISGADPVLGNTVTAIDPVTGAVGPSVWVGSEPRRLALSDDGQVLYVALDGAFAVRRVDVPTLTAGLQYTVGADQSAGPYVAADLAVVPGSTNSVAVVRKPPSSSGDGGVGLFVDGTMRPLVTPGPYGSRVLAFSGVPTRLYGFNNYTSGFELFRLSVGSDGITVVDSTRFLLSGYDTNIRFAGDHLYGGNGRVVDPESRTILGLFPQVSTSGSLTAVAVDTSVGRAYAIAGTAPSMVRAYDLNTFRFLWSLPVPEAQLTWQTLVTSGTNRLAFRTTAGQVFLLDLGSARALAVALRGTGSGSVSSAPAGLQCGVECAQLFAADSTVTLTVTPAADSSFVRWEGPPDCADGVVTLSAAYTCTAVFAQAPFGPLLRMPLPINDLTFSPVTGKIYVSVGGKDPVLGNTVASVDPATGAIGPSVWVGSEPRRLALSDDGRTLYVGLAGAAAIGRVDVLTLTTAPSFPVGVSASDGPLVAYDLAVPPGSADVVAVARRTLAYSSDGGVAIYAGGLIRPNIANSSYTTRALAFSGLPSRLYAQDESGGFLRMNVDGDGVVLADRTAGLVPGSGIRFQNGRVYSHAGRVVDPETLAVLGTYALSAGYASLVLPDAMRGVTYALEQSTPGTLHLRLYDAAQFTRRQSVALGGTSGAVAGFIASGMGRFAFCTDSGQLALLSHVGVVAARPARDFDADVRADVAVFRPSTGTWFALESSTNNSAFSARGWGLQAEGDIPVVGDFDGDGVVDPTVFRPASGTWFVLTSSSGYADWRWFGWGIATDALVPADYDGDGMTDAAVYRPSEGRWFIRPSTGASGWSVVFGEIGDVPLAGDFDGDGKADLCVYRAATGTWFVLSSSSGFTSWSYQGWGVEAEGDTPAPGDFDGDGKTDMCVFRPASGTWFILNSSSNNTDWTWFGWGQAADVVAPADYDGDGVTDAAVYRPETGTWFVRPSSGTGPWSVVFGESGDVPLAGIR
jgi:sugar lactone lactonase YvrE